jgi:hypothetical protein
MDEFWLTGESLLRYHKFYTEIWPAKTTLYMIFFRLAFLPGGDSIDTILIARFMTVTLSLATLGVVYLLARRIGRSQIESLFVVAVALSFSSYVEWAFMVRPEPLAAFFSALALYIVVRQDRGYAWVFCAGLLCGLAFLTTQKAVFFNLAVGLALVMDALVRRSIAQAFLLGAVLVVGWALVVALYGLGFGLLGANLADLYRHIFLGPPLDNVKQGHTFYDQNLRTFVFQSIFRNPVLYAVSLFGWVLIFLRAFRISRPERMVWIYSGVIVALVFSLPAPWPYNFVMALPWLAIWLPVVLRVFFADHAGFRFAVITACLVLGVISLMRNVSYLTHDNTYQSATLRFAESLLEPDESYMDGIGMLVTRDHYGNDRPGVISNWDGPTIYRLRSEIAAGNDSVIERYFASQPKLWILTYRTKALARFLDPYLKASYVPVSSNVLIAGVAVGSDKETIYQNWWPGAYRLYGADGRPRDLPLIVDGRESSGVVELSEGESRLRVLSDVGEPVFLLPANLKADFQVPETPEQGLLFPNTYNF